MRTVTVSENFAVVIPEELREKLGLKPGDQLDIYERDGGIRISRHHAITELRGIAKGIKWDDYRDRDHEERF